MMVEGERENLGSGFRSQKGNPGATFLSYAILIGGIATIAVTLYMVVITYSSLPFRDGWTQAEVAANGQNPLSPTWLWRQNYEHRLVIPKLFLAADLRLFQARQVFLLASIFVIQFLHLALLCWSMWVLGSWRGALWRTGAGLAAFCLFCPSQWENFIWGFQVCFVLPQLLASLSFVALLLYWVESQQHPDKPPVPFLVLSVLGALGATYSLANGNVLWPLLIVAALYLRMRAAVVLSFLITGLLSTALYFHNYVRPPIVANPISSLEAPIRLLKYCVAYFLSSWAHHNMPAAEIFALAVLAIVVLGLLAPGLSYARSFRVFAIQLVLTMAFCAATALITAAGRLNFGSSQASASRYQTVALLFWCCLGLLLLGSTFSRPRRRYLFVVAQLFLLMLFARGAILARYPIEESRQHEFALNATAASLLTGVHDPVQLRWAFFMDRLLKTARYMKANHLSVFSSGISSELGKPLDSVFPLAAVGDCAGALESVVPMEEPGGAGLRLAGWTWDSKHQRPPSAIIVTTNGIISGVGAVDQGWPSVDAVKPGRSSNYVGYIGYPEPQPPSRMNLYAILRGEPPVACYFAAK